METVFVQHQLNYVMPEGEYNEEPSMTQPDEVLSIREMLIRHARGIAPDTPHGEGNYYPEELGFIPDIDSMDLSEIAEARDALTRRVKAIKDRLSKDNQPLPAPAASGKPPEAPSPLPVSQDFTPSAPTTSGSPVSEGDEART